MKPAGGGTESKLKKLEGGAVTKLKIAVRAVYSLEAKHALEKLIVDTKPDIVYCLNIVNHMSPSVINAAQSHSIPVAMRLSDYNLICANYLLLHDGQTCTDCEHGYYHALKHKCVYGSTSATLCRVAAMYTHKIIGVYKKVGAFVTPSSFMRDALIRNGFPKSKIHHIPTFVNASQWTPRYDNDGYILHFGRLSPEKGIEFLLQSYLKSGVQDPLWIAGECANDYMDQVKARFGADRLKNVTFLGQKSGDDLREIVRGAKYVVVPSLCFDNSPNVIYESFAAGKPVIGSALGGICEQVTKNTGMLVEPGNVEQLAQAITKLSDSPQLIEELGTNARDRVLTNHNIEAHVERLLGLFETLIAR
jgi:glycosyltransferase involved in cell wall biosynthesis